jgi:hypothetical protein
MYNDKQLSKSYTIACNIFFSGKKNLFTDDVLGMTRQPGCKEQPIGTEVGNSLIRTSQENSTEFLKFQTPNRDVSIFYTTCFVTSLNAAKVTKILMITNDWLGKRNKKL